VHCGWKDRIRTYNLHYQKVMHYRYATFQLQFI
jgi:hypothetical protein